MFTNSKMSWHRLFWAILVIFFVSHVVLFSQDFTGFDSPTLGPVTNSPEDWGLKIVVLNVGQADAIVVMTPNGDVVLIDSGIYKRDAQKIAEFLGSETLNAVGKFKTIDLRR